MRDSFFWVLGVNLSNRPQLVYWLNIPQYNSNAALALHHFINKSTPTHVLIK